MAESVTIVTLNQMIDLSLNCNEGIINFQVLHTFLHVVVQQMKLHDVAVEFRGPDSDKIQALISTVKPGSTHLLPKYNVVPEESGKLKKKNGGQKKKASLQDVIIEKERQKLEEKKEKEIRVIERRKDSKEDPDLNPLPLKSPPGSLLGVTPADLQTVVVVESQSTLPQYTVALTKNTFDNLQRDLDTLKLQLKELTELPANMGLIEATRSQSSPILDMFQILHLTKRMDANETALEKIGSLIEDLVKSDKGQIPTTIIEKIQEVRASVDENQKYPTERRRSSLSEVEARLTNLENVVNNLNENVTAIATGVGEYKPQEAILEKIQSPEPSLKHSDNASITKTETSVVKTEGSVAPEGSSVKTPSRKSTIKSQAEPVKIMAPQVVYQSQIQDVDLGEMPPNQALQLIQEEFQNLKNWMTESIQEVDKLKAFAPPAAGEVDSRVVESKFNECSKKIAELNNLYNTQIKLLNEQFNSVQSEMNEVATKLDIILPGGDSTGISAETTMDLANKLTLLEKEMIAISEKAEELQQEKEQRDKQTETIMEQIDILKIVKANREDLEDALGEKADACMINRKVSHDQFDAACDDLYRGIEEALSKLEEQEEMWHQALDSIQREVGNKLDKMEVDPLRDFVNSKLKALQEKFKSLSALKREQEAAGTKTRFLRNVNCISCDKDVIMRKEMDVSLKPKAYAMPANRNMAPYLAYELDQLRKQQKCVPNSKNLNFIESALKTRGNKEKNHLCNRYCGGSHTVTTPQQRVTRLGHFLEQWGPEIAPLQDEYIRGNDNHMYKARDETVFTKKGSKVESGPKGNLRPSTGGAPMMEQEVPQQGRNTFVSAEAHKIVSKEAEEAANKKTHNIGATHIEEVNQAPQQDTRTSTDQRGSHLQVKISIIEEPVLEQKLSQKGSQVGKSVSQLSNEQQRKSQSAEVKTSQLSTEQQRKSQSQSVTAEGKTSQLSNEQQRKSQSQSVTAEGKTSQLSNEQQRSQSASVAQKGSAEAAEKGQE
ncbi:uncharacterized protein LOC123003652 [Tribolium madens]|uniref:uncharacterized protein LOC123003652 n=1 Tax=Tribolium madens TaxID=41895 RepID=UPI001CF72B54|nr:uncharacterized protein LOC123003652 [Tribolium madens]